VLNEDILLSFQQRYTFDYHNTIYYILLGILAGFVSLYHAKAFQKVEGHFARLKMSGYRKALYGAVPLALLIFFFPMLFGEGYETIKTLAHNPEALLSNTLLDDFKGNAWVLLLF